MFYDVLKTILKWKQYFFQTLFDICNFNRPVRFSGTKLRQVLRRKETKNTTKKSIINRKIRVWFFFVCGFLSIFCNIWYRWLIFILRFTNNLIFIVWLVDVLNFYGRSKYFNAGIIFILLRNFVWRQGRNLLMCSGAK